MLKQVEETVVHKKEESDYSQAPAMVLAMCSGKGGVGKSFLSLNLGLKLSQLNQRVLVIDADLGLANVSLMANLNPKHTVDNVLKEECVLSEAITTYSNLHILAGTAEISQADMVFTEKEERIRKVLSEAKKSYDFILIDAQLGISLFSLSFFRGADKLVLIATPQPTSISNTYALLKFLLSKDPQKEIGIVWNMVSSQKEAGQLKEKFEILCDTFLGLKTADMGWVENDEQVEKSISKQIPLIIKYPFSQAAVCIEKIAFGMINEKHQFEKSDLGVWQRAKAEVK